MNKSQLEARKTRFLKHIEITSTEPSYERQKRKQQAELKIISCKTQMRVKIAKLLRRQAEILLEINTNIKDFKCENLAETKRILEITTDLLEKIKEKREK